MAVKYIMPRQNFLAFILNCQGLVAPISLVRQFCMTDGHNQLLNPTLHKWACGKYMYSALHPQKSNSHTFTHTLLTHIYTLTHPHSLRSTCCSCRCGRPCHRRYSQCPGWNPSVPELTKVILGQSLALDQLTLWNTTGERWEREREREWELMLTGLLSAETSSMRSTYSYRPL